MKFYTVINCMDGRVQLPVIQYLQKRFEIDFVDSVTEAGPNLILSESKFSRPARSILSRVEISLKQHNSAGISVVGHHDCAGNPAPRDKQIIHIHNAVHHLQQKYQNVTVNGLWVDDHWDVHELS